ncbi:NOSIP family protein [Megaselia abdita]
MTRHARNCTAGAVYTYHEKKRDAQEGGYGTTSRRLGKDSVKSFDCCSLSLQPCRNPVVTKEGYLFDKESILQYIITKKNEYSRKLKEYEKLRKEEVADEEFKGSAKERERIDKFMKTEKNITTNTNRFNIGKKVEEAVAGPSSSSSSSISNMSNGKETCLPSFWHPSQTPNAGKAKAKKPDSTIFCPISEKPLKVKDLIPVKFTLLKDDSDKRSLIAKENRYMCPVTHDILSNAIACVVLKPTGDVITMECFEKLIKKDMLHPLTGEKLQDKDIIPLQRGSTGYAITNDNLEGKNAQPALQV